MGRVLAAPLRAAENALTASLRNTTLADVVKGIAEAQASAA
jgi:DNA-binding IscR family transcriptional regulator